jgi:DnaJ-class molecular chaperone
MSVEIKIEFEHECYICGGRSTWTRSEPCQTCNSTGRVPTELGRNLLEFLEHQGFQLPTAAKDED